MSQKGCCPCENKSRLIAKTANHRVFKIENDSGNMVLTEYTVFPGVYLLYKDVHLTRHTDIWPPQGRFLEVNYCREGRFEYETEEHFFYLAPGDLSIHIAQGKKTETYYPTGHYHGVSVIVKPGEAPECFSCFLEDVNVKPLALQEKFCQNNEYFIMRSTPRLEHIFSELYSVPERVRQGYHKIKVLELFLFLSSIDPTLSETKQRSCSKTQIQLAKQVCSYIHEHIKERLTIEHLASAFNVSPTQLQNCFKSVYGDSVYAYIRKQKMQWAAKLLKETDRTIIDIAAEYGYHNGSKFAKAFLDVMGVSPKEYRQLARGSEVVVEQVVDGG